jgi:methionyl aminopeptidase
MVPVSKHGDRPPEDLTARARIRDAALAQFAERGYAGTTIKGIAEAAGFSIVREYVGHGVGRDLHEAPQVPNYGPPGKGYILDSGLVVAIEPMINAGGAATRLLEDGWTVVTADGSLSAHFEHTVAVTADGPLVITRRTPR